MCAALPLMQGASSRNCVIALVCALTHSRQGVSNAEAPVDDLNDSFAHHVDLMHAASDSSRGYLHAGPHGATGVQRSATGNESFYDAPETLSRINSGASLSSADGVEHCCLPLCSLSSAVAESHRLQACMRSLDVQYPTCVSSAATKSARNISTGPFAQCNAI